MPGAAPSLAPSCGTERCGSKQLEVMSHLLACCAALCAGTLLTLTTAAADVYVSPEGKPSGDGSLASPWDLATVNAMPANDIILSLSNMNDVEHWDHATVSAMTHNDLVWYMN